jgi:hypothetical protein
VLILPLDLQHVSLLRTDVKFDRTMLVSVVADIMATADLAGERPFKYRDGHSKEQQPSCNENSGSVGGGQRISPPEQMNCKSKWR